MKISIAMCTYNGEKYLEKQLYSLLNQTKLPKEIVVSDDASTDNTINILKNFKKNNKHIKIRILKSRENIGYIKNFHKALRKTAGDIIFLCDQDDIWENKKIETLCKLFEENPQISAIATSFEFIDKYDNKVIISEFDGVQHYALEKQKLKRKSLVKMSEKEIITGNVSPGCTCAFRAEIKNNYCKKASLIIPHDWEINIYASQIGKLYFYHEPLIKYRIHNENAIGLAAYHTNLKSFFKDIPDKNLEIKSQEISKKFVVFLSNHYEGTKDVFLQKYINDLIVKTNSQYVNYLIEKIK